MEKDLKRRTNHFRYISDYYKNKDIAEKYDEQRFSSFSGRLFNGLEKHCIAKLIRFLKKKYSIKSILDIPCGTGRITELAAKERLTVSGADISEEMIKVAQKRLSGFENVTYQITDIKNMAYPDNYFDCVICIRLFHHLDFNDRVAILKELTRVTKSYVIMNISFSSPWYRLRRRLKRMIGQHHSLTAVANKDLMRDLKECGLLEVKRKFVLPVISEDLILVLRKSC